jgi:hypothetical protein
MADSDRGLIPMRQAALVLLPVCMAKIVLHVLCLTQYGYFRDELYYLASLNHLDFGYVEHPPFFIYLLAAWRSIAGDSLAAVRILALLAGTAHVIAVGLMARFLGGRALAIGLAAAATALMPILLGTQHMYSMNVIDELFWALTGLALIPIFRSAEPRNWIILGFLLGLGLMNKISVLWLGAGIGAALLLTPERRWLATRWPWIAGGIALLFLFPYVVWQWLHGFPLLEFMRNAAERKMVNVSALEFLRDQALSMNPFVLPLSVAGVIGIWFSRGAREMRWAWIVGVTVVLILIVPGNSKPYYLAGAYPFFLVPGAIVLESLLKDGWKRKVGWGYAAVIAATGVLSAPMAIPLLPEEQLIAYMEQIGISPPRGERMQSGSLPQHFADMHGWEGFVEEVARVYNGLSPEERGRCAIFVRNYGEAGAIDVLGRKAGLPRAVSGHNTYWYWGPGGMTGEVVIMVGGNLEEEREAFESVERVGTTPDDPYAMPYERNRPVYLCRGLKIPVAEAWKRAKDLI